MRSIPIWPRIAMLVILLMPTAPTFSLTPAIGFCDAPTILPRNTPLSNFSPALCFSYNDLGTGTYTLSVHLLDTVNHFCASGQWCNAVFLIDNSDGMNSSGTMTIVRNMDVYDYPGFEWKIDLYNQIGIVASATQPVTSTTNRAPRLGYIGNRTSLRCHPLGFYVTASDPENDDLSLVSQDLPPGSAFDPVTGRFEWPCPAPGNYTSLFKATQSGIYPLSDAEKITFQISGWFVHLPIVMNEIGSAP